MVEKGALFVFGILFGKCDPVKPVETDPPFDPPARAAAPVGGGEGYGDWQRADNAISTLDELKGALVARQRLIYVADDAVIDVGGETLHVAAGTTIASGRGRGQGGLIRMLVDGRDPMFIVELGDEATRFTGLRLQGPDPSENAPDCDSWGRTAIKIENPGTRDDFTKIKDQRLEIDNNELFAWTVAVQVEGTRGTRVHHNYFHHNRRHAHRLECAVRLEFHALGYGVAINSGHALIEANIFEMNRHAIASHGSRNTVYEAYDNVVRPGNVSHSFDMHGGVDREDGTYIAGDVMIIAFNTFTDPDHDAVNIRGYPVTGAWVFNNKLINGQKSVMQTKIPSLEHKRVYVFDNEDLR